MKLRETVLFNPVIYLIIGLFIFSCSDKVPENEIIAKVGDRIITKDEFINSYEFSVELLRRGEKPHRTYLNYMIKELLLSNEGFAKALNKSH